MRAIERDKLIEQFFKEDMKLLRAKGHDYAGEENCLANLQRFGLFGIIVRMSDKFSRIEQFAKSGRFKVVGEGMNDTLRDISNYCYLARIFLQENNK